MATGEKYPVLNRDNVTIAIQIQLSQKQKFFITFWLHFRNLSESLNVLEKKMTHIAFVFPKLMTSKTWLDKCLKSSVLEDPSTSNMVNLPKHC